MNPETIKKINECKALQGKTVEDLINDERLRNNLAAYMTAQKEDRKQVRASYEAMRKMGGAKGFKLPAHPIDHLINLTVGEFAAEFMAVISKKSGRPFAERRYIQQLGMQAYNLTVVQYVVDEHPELEAELMPKPKNAN